MGTRRAAYQNELNLISRLAENRPLLNVGGYLAAEITKADVTPEITKMFPKALDGGYICILDVARDSPCGVAGFALASDPRGRARRGRGCAITRHRESARGTRNRRREDRPPRTYVHA